MNKNKQSLNEGFLTDMLNGMLDPDNFSIFNSIANRIIGTKQDPMNFTVNTNIAKAASGLTAVFPVLVTEATSLDTAVMISKSIERKAVALLQMLFAANQITNATGAQDYLKNFYSNLSGSLDLSDIGVDDMIEISNKISESVNDPDYGVAINEAIEKVKEDTKMMIHNHLSGDINHVSLNEFKITMNPLTVHEANGTSFEYRYDENGDRRLDRETRTIELPIINDIKATYEILNKQIIRSDVQKANEAVPSMMIINFVSMVKGEKVVNTAIIGVKAMLHYIPSESMVNRIVLKNSDNRGLFNFIRATTREISFFRDFLFAVDRAKIDAVSKSGKGSANKIWKLLELRANKAKMYKASGKNVSDVSAITSIIISKAEIDLIRKYHRIDLSRPGTLMSIMRGYNLMCSVVVDEVLEKVDFLYDDGTTRFETLTFNSLEREENNGTYKKVINLMTKGR